MGISYKDEIGNFNDCELNNVKDGYFNSPDIFDTYKFKCNYFTGNYRKYVAIHQNRNFSIQTKEVYVIMNMKK